MQDVSGSGIEPEFLSVAQVARRLGCSVSLVQKWRRLGWLPATRLGPPDVPVYGYRPADIERFVSERWNRQRGRPTLGSAGLPETPPPTVTADTAPPVPEPGDAGPGSLRQPSERFKPTRLQPVVEGQSAIQPTVVDAGAGRGAMAGETLVETLPATAPAAVEPAGVVAAVGEVSQVAAAESIVPPVIAEPPVPSEPPPPPLKTTGRPLVMWDSDPREGSAIILARFPAEDVGAALSLALAWSRRYNDVVLGESPRPGAQPNVLAQWHGGQRLPVS